MKSLTLKVQTNIISNNLDDYAAELKAKINSVKTDLQTDEDFAEAKELVKSFKSAEDALLAVKEQIFEGGDLRKINDTIIELHELTRQKRLSLNKLVENEEKAKKQNLVDVAFKAVEEAHSNASHSRYIPFPEASEFQDQIKNKRKLDSIKNSLDMFVGIKIQEINSASSKLDDKHKQIMELINGHESLFSVDELMRIDGSVEQIIKDRIARHEAEVNAAAEAKAREMAKEQEASQQVAPEPRQQAHPIEQVSEPVTESNVARFTPAKTTLDTGEQKQNFMLRVAMPMHVTPSEAKALAKQYAEKYGRSNVSLSVVEDAA